MGIFDRIIGKKSAKDGPAPGGEKKPEEKKKKPAPVKAEKKKDKPVKKSKAEKPKKNFPSRKIAKKEENQAHSILIAPIISEKSTVLGQFNKYVFKVSQRADKSGIKSAIEDYYGVGVTKVNIVKIHPKKRMQGRKIGWKQGFKKAIVTLQEGDTIGITEGV